jgi:deoxycytidylate deaminase
MIINAGIAKIYYRSGYADELARDMLAEAAIDMIQIVGSETDEKLKWEHSVGDSGNESIHSGGGGDKE